MLTLSVDFKLGISRTLAHSVPFVSTLACASQGNNELELILDGLEEPST